MGLLWQAAAEAEAATLSIAKRAIPDASSTEEANQIVRWNWIKAIDEHHQQFGNSRINDIIDIGCSVGVSTRCLADKYPGANITVSTLSCIHLWFYYSLYLFLSDLHLGNWRINLHILVTTTSQLTYSHSVCLCLYTRNSFLLLNLACLCFETHFMLSIDVKCSYLVLSWDLFFCSYLTWIRTGMNYN